MIEKMSLATLLTKTYLAKDRTEANRLIAQGAVFVNGERIEDNIDVELEDEFSVNVGKTKAVRVSVYTGQA